MQHARSSSRRLAFGGLALAAAILGIGASAFAWDRAHSVGSNTGLAFITTAPAKKAPITVPNLGSFAHGAGPVAAPDGTVYLGNQQGKLIALHADGSAYWSRDITPGHEITAPPAVTSDGSIYVIGTTTYTDHRVTPAVKVSKSMLNIFIPGGGWKGAFPFPDHDGPGVALGPLNIWRLGSKEVLIVTAIYKPFNYGGYDVRLLAFEGAQVVADQLVTRFTAPDITGSGISIGKVLKCLTIILCPDFSFEHGILPVPEPPAPQVAIESSAPHIVVVSDNIKDVVGYSFDGSSFTKVWRAHDPDYFMRSTPTILPDGHTIIGVEKIKRKDGQEYLDPEQGAVFFTGQNVPPLPRLKVGRVYTAPTVTGDGRTVLVVGEGHLIVLRGAQIEKDIQIPGSSIASAAASFNHLFVSTPDAFITYDVNTLDELARINWVGGGLSSPVIGPQGHVYAIASNILFVFPPPVKKPLPGVTITDPLVGTVATDPPPTQPASQRFNGPLTPMGYRLFACQELDGDDCGKSTNKAVALAFCQQKGFASVDKVDTEIKKVQAARLDGQLCTQNKCKVFDEIVCKN